MQNRNFLKKAALKILLESNLQLKVFFNKYFLRLIFLFSLLLFFNLNYLALLEFRKIKITENLKTNKSPKEKHQHYTLKTERSC